MKNNLLTERLAYNGENETRTHAHLLVYSAETFKETVYDHYQDINFDQAPNERIWLRIHGLKDSEFINAICTHFNIDFLSIQDEFLQEEIRRKPSSRTASHNKSAPILYLLTYYLLHIYELFVDLP